MELETATGKFTQVVLQNTTAPHNKEYRIALEISETPRVLTQWGRIGHVNRQQVRTFTDAQAAVDYVETLFRQQLDWKGYHAVGGWTFVELTAPAAPTGAVAA